MRTITKITRVNMPGWVVLVVEFTENGVDREARVPWPTKARWGAAVRQWIRNGGVVETSTPNQAARELLRSRVDLDPVVAGLMKIQRYLAGNPGTDWTNNQYRTQLVNAVALELQP